MAVQSDEPMNELKPMIASTPTQRPASMQRADRREVSSIAPRQLTIAIAATFTADPLQHSLEFWLRALNIPGDVAFAPYAQVMQELLDPDSLFGHNRSGVNILLIRLDDWLRPEHTAVQSRAQLQGVGTEFITALASLRARTSASTLVCFCPPASSLTAEHRELVSEIRYSLITQVASMPRTHSLDDAELMKLYPIAELEDPQANRIGHVPYTTEYFAAVGTLLARRIAALTKPPYKVIAVDCDNTLWRGICGEVGADGIEVTPAHRRFQQMLVQQHDSGVLLCMCSKNNARDVDEVFRKHPEMPLRKDHLVASRVNWESKASNLRALSEELSLALDSFIFIDDSPMECAEVQIHCPSVLTLAFPGNQDDIFHFLDHVWAFDRVGVTEDAKRRTTQYKENRARSVALKKAGDLDLDQFLASLQVQVELRPMQSSQLDRVAELVQRTNQFNLSGIRRGAGEIEALWKSGELQVLVAYVSDRFGDYGLVGAVFFRYETNGLDVDTFLLSCRVLGRRVEYQIVRELGRFARQRGLSDIVLRFRSSSRNAPARRFLDKAFSQFQGASADASGTSLAEFRIPVNYTEDLPQGAATDDLVHEEIARAGVEPTAQSIASHEWHETAYRISRLTDIVQEVRRFAAGGRLATQAEYIAPRNPTEVALEQIWSAILSADKVSVEANFFDYGGNSLLAVQVLARIESVLGLELSLFDFVQAPTIAEVAKKLADASTSDVPIEHHDSIDTAPLSSAQQRLWFIDQLDGERMAYHVPLIVRLTGALDLQALHSSLDSIVVRHESLRTIFIKGETEVVQKIAPHADFALHVFDVRADSPEAHESAVIHHSKEELETPFDLSTGPLIRGRLLVLSDDKHVLLITMHHIVSDAWSIGLFLQELSAIYGAHGSNRTETLAPLPIQYADYARWQRKWLAGAQLRAGLSYWKEHLQGAPELLMLPTDRPRPITRSYRGGNVRVSLDPDLTKELKDFSRRHGLTLAMTLHTAWVILLSRLSGQNDIVVGIPVANRRRIEFEGLIGLFVNTLAVRMRLDDDPDITQLIERVKQVMLSAYANQDVPFEQVVEVLHPARRLSHQPIFQVMLAMENTPRAPMQPSHLTFVGERLPQQTAQFDLLLSLEETGDKVVGALNYACDLLDHATVERWCGYLDSVLRGMVRRPGLSVSRLPLFGGDERRSLIEFFNEPRARYQHETLIHDLFEAQVHRAPNAVAVIFGGTSLTYTELNQKANQLARYLQSKHVGPDTLVALYVERGIEMVIGILGILKAGGAFVALEPQYPIERLQFMLKDAAPTVLLTQQHMMVRVPQTSADVVQLDRDWAAIGQRPGNNLDGRALGLHPSNLAYVIYTSGSTGQPKGVMVEHRNVTRLFAATDEWFHFSEHDIWTLFHSIAFDFSVWELWGALLYGGRVLVVPYMTARSPREFYRLLCQQGVTVLNQTPSSFAQLIEAQAQDPETRHNLRLVIFGGEALELYKLRPWAGRNDIRQPQLVNMYGITETTVHVTYRPLTEEEIKSDATSPIGRPIPDLQLYLLDANREPVPIGVVGEIYVGGAGVSRGYMNRPELTAERLIADPFSKVERSRLYRSGDLGRRRPDGTIEYLGRNDHQIKIRGFRIELGEIEAQLARHEQVKQAVVLAREDVSGETRLIAYIVLREPTHINATGADAFRAHLKSVLPEYMLPTAFVVLPSFPLTSNGKLDRKALPAPEVDAYVRSQYEAPLGEGERVLAEIWQQLLQADNVGRKDNFFELGGHSLLVISLLSKIQQFFGTTLKVTDVYKSPTLQELSMRIYGASAADDLVNLSHEAVLSCEIRPLPGPVCSPASVVLMTGATGFVGRFLLVQLLQYAHATIYCLVRAQSRQQAAERIKSALMKWDLWKEEFERRIVAIPGDLNLPWLGLDETAYRLFAEKVESIYHCGTSMNHLETYAMAKPANVNSASELLKLATHGRRKVVNYISSLGVFSSDGTNKPRVVTEVTPIDQEQHPASHGYAASKWVAEKIFMIASERGIPCNIFRLGLVWADAQKGRYDDLQREYRILKSCLLSGYGIKGYRYAMPPTPVDYVARAVVSLANRYPDGQGIFHISSSRQRVDGVFECCNGISEIGLQLKAVSDWIAALKRLHRDGVTLPVMPLIESSFTIDETEGAGSQISIGPSHSHIDCSKTYRELERDGIFAPDFNDHLVRLCVEDMLIRDEDLRQAVRPDGKGLEDQLHKLLVGRSSS